ncbi:MAG: hypothetical protein PHC88_16625 [Terrimicrobiaceae bacterium]|nr:hypothetical protein [Terrimicrobiaceae bacterium]
MDDLCILVPVWRDYRWLIPITLAQIERFWPGHPPLFLIGLTEEEAAGVPHFPVSDPAKRGNWCWVVRDGVWQAAARFRKAYLIAEEHPPLARCHSIHLNHTLPREMDRWDAVYISLMGWDNRRYASRNRRLGRDRHCMMHLARKHAPRFHLHPALWRLDALERCGTISLRDENGRGSAWHFEKTCEKLDADLPAAWKSGCYQIAAFALACESSPFRTLAALSERWIFNRMMALVPWLPNPRWAAGYLRLLAIDNVFCGGPTP